jgi:hypothetical protein
MAYFVEFCSVLAVGTAATLALPIAEDEFIFVYLWSSIHFGSVIMISIPPNRF